MKVKNLRADGWCPVCKNAKGYTYNVAHSSDPDAIELPEMCSCDGTVPVLPSCDGIVLPSIVVRGDVSEEALRAMVSKVVADALAALLPVKEVPLD